MSQFLNKLKTHVVETHSPDETVLVTLGGQFGITIEFEEAITAIHTEDSIEAQLESAVREAIEAYETGVQQLRAETYGVNGHLAVSKEQEQIIAMRDSLTFSIQSPTRHIALDWAGSNDIVFAISPETFIDLTDDEFALEVNSILAAAFTIYNKAITAIQKQIYLEKLDPIRRGA